MKSVHYTECVVSSSLIRLYFISTSQYYIDEEIRGGEILKATVGNLLEFERFRVRERETHGVSPGSMTLW